MAGEPRLQAFPDRILTAFRYADFDTPFWVRPNHSPGRWHQAGHGPTQYLSLHPDAAWAELLSVEALRAEADLTLVRTRIWVVRAHAAPLADLSSFARAARSGVDPAALIADDHHGCQALRAVIERAGFRGVVAPSAALPGALALTLFGPRRRIPWDTEPRLASTLPADIVAVGGPPAGLTRRVRYRGEPHVGHQRYLRELP